MRNFRYLRWNGQKRHGMANVEPLPDGWRPTQTWLGQLGSEQPPADTSTKANRSDVMFDESIRTKARVW